VINNNTTWI